MLKTFLVFACLATCLAQTPPCQEAFRKYAFTDCSENGERSAFEFWNTTCDQTLPGSPTLNTDPRTGPCEMECPSGSFYSPRFIGCERCAYGEVSYTGDTLSNFAPWPASLVTYCSPMPCEVWQPSGLGSYLTSGNQTGSSAVVVTLVMDVNVVKYYGGRVTFAYRAESEAGFDGLALYINNTRKRFADTGIFLSTGVNNDVWKDFDIILPRGTTEIRWTYEKDSSKSTFPSGRIGRDRAFLSNIRVDGPILMRDMCSPCQAGYKAVPTADRCDLCPPQTYAAQGSTKCFPCPPGTFAKAGAAACSPKPKCQASDYTARYTPCNALTRSRSLVFKPTTGDCLDIATPPPVIGVCAACMKGKSMVGNKCVQTNTIQCDAGTAAVPSLLFTDFDSLDGNLRSNGFQTSCTGLCAPGAGWEVFPIAGAVAIHSGSLMGPTADSRLTLRSTLASAGYVTFTYFFYRRLLDPRDQISGTFYIGNQPYTLDTTFNSPNSAYGTFKSGILPPGTYDFLWEFTKDFIDDQTSLVIRSLEVFGDVAGGTSTCTACFPGYMCPGQSTKMVQCPAGTFSSSASTCSACAPNTIAPATASTTCQSCPPTATATADGTSCVYSCLITDGDYTYDLRPLKAVKYGPMFRGDPMIDIVADALYVERFFLKLCQAVAEPGCQANGNSFVCARFATNKTLSLGTTAVFKNNKYSGLTVTYTGGDRCDAGTRNTQVVLRCDSDKSNTFGKTRFMGEDPPCKYNFEILTPTACPSCTMASYMMVYSACAPNGTQFLMYVKKPEAEGCYTSDFTPPDPVQRDCNVCKPEYYDAVWSGCDFSGYQRKMWVLNLTKAGCFETPKSTPVPEVKRCMQLELALGMNPATIVLIVILVLMGLCGVMVVYGHKTKNGLLMKYENVMLKTISGGMGKKAGTGELDHAELN